MRLTNHTWPISHHIMPLVITALRGGHTDTDKHRHTYVQTKTISRNQPHVPGLKTEFHVTHVANMQTLFNRRP